MTTNNHPITPLPELVQQWINEEDGIFAEHIATQAARWGADQELEACEKYWRAYGISPQGVARMHETRRPKPPSLKEQALEELSLISISPESGVRVSALDTIRRALEQLDD